MSRKHWLFGMAFLAVGMMNQVAQGAGLEDLTPVSAPEKIAPGIWRISIGDLSDEIRYTDYVAEPPQMAALNAKSDPAYPFSATPISFYQSPDHKIMVKIPANANESLFGFGLQLDNIKQTRRVMDLEVDHWKKGGGRTHAPVPFYISNKGYGVFINTARFLKAYVQVGNRKDSPSLPQPVDRNPVTEDPDVPKWSSLPASDAVEAQIAGNGMEVLIFAGDDLQDIVARYNLYCGGGALPPLWGLGFWHRVPASFNADECNREVRQFEEKKFPLDVLGLEPGWMSSSYPCTYEWQTARFADPAAFTARLLNKGIRLNLWENPYISPKSRIYEKMFPLSGSHTVWLGIVPDYTLPEARRILTGQHKTDHLDIGVSGYKIDEVDGYDKWLWPNHATFPSQTSAETMRQTYGLLMENMIYKDLFKKNNRRTYGLIRANNGAASGYPFVLYSDSYNHAEYITGLSSASLAGVLWSPEVRKAENSREWLNRIQTVCFSPLAQLNAWSSGTKPWEYDDVTDSVREVIQLRLRLLPYLYTAFADYHYKGIPPVRAMILEKGFEEDGAVVKEGKLDGVTNPYEESTIIQKTDQFMFGPSILVAPFYEDMSTERTVILPPGKWYDFYTGKLVGNNQTITVTAKENRTPLFVKDGALISMLAENILNTEQAYGMPLEIRHYGQADGSCDVYEDDGKTFDYETAAAYRIRSFSIKKGEQRGRETISGKADISLFGPVAKWTSMTP